MIHPHTQVKYISDEIGYGIFATQFIPKGAIVYVADDLEVRLTEDHPLLGSPHYNEIIQKYSYVDDEGTLILSWDNAKYVNHSCDPNSLSTGYGFEIAVRDIESGEELTDDYSIFCRDVMMPCSCGTPACRGVVSSSDHRMMTDAWDASCRSALAQFLDVSQPLMPFLDRKTHRRVLRYLNTGKGYHGVNASAKQAARRKRTRKTVA